MARAVSLSLKQQFPRGLGMETAMAPSVLLMPHHHHHHRAHNQNVSCLLSATSTSTNTSNNSHHSIPAVHFLSLTFVPTTKGKNNTTANTNKSQPFSAAVRYISSSSYLDFRSQGLLSHHSLSDSESDSNNEEEVEEDSIKRKSRNERKREARRAVRWGIDLSTFSPPQIKQVVRAASLDQEVFDAFMLVKKLGPDVREGKRRQFNYIGKLLRSAEPELMDTLIQALKNGEKDKLMSLSGGDLWSFEQDEDEEETENDDDEVSDDYVHVAARWFDGLIGKDSDVTREVYSVHNVEFDRQELRKLVRRVQSMQESQLEGADENQVDAALNSAKRSLTRFLRTLAKKSLTTEWT